MNKMKRPLGLLLTILLIILTPIHCLAAEEQTDTQPTPAPFIIDTDFSSDVDDALAISVAAYFQDMGLIDIRGVALCCTSTRGAYAMSALLGQHKIWDIPIACDCKTGIPIGSKYHLGMTSYPHSETYYADMVNFYRMFLASSVEKVNIVVLGQIVNIKELMNSKPDVHSPLTGYELIQEKIDTIYFVGGKSNGKLENNIFYGGENYGNNPYYNNTKMAETTKYVTDNIPCRMVWLEADIVGSFSVGGFLEKTDRTASDILTKALKDYGTTYGSASFDPFGVYIAALDANNMLDEHMLALQAGTMRINLNGTSYFTIDDPTRDHYRIEKLVNDGYYQSEINQMLEYEYIKRSGNTTIRY